MKSITIFNKCLTVAFAAAALFTTSCKKDSTNGPAQSTRLVKIEESATDYTTFEYNAAGAVSKMTAIEGQASEVINLNYTNNKLVSATSANNAIKFNYNANNQLDKVDLHEGDLQTQPFSYLQFAYQNNVISSVTTYTQIGNNPNMQGYYKLAYDYYDNGDIKSMKEYQYDFTAKNFQLASTVTYEYDTHNNPLLSLGEIYQVSFEMPSKHNPVKAVTTDKNNNLVQTTTYTYTYNTNGYPTKVRKQSIVPGQANATVSEIKYTYQ